MDHVLDWMKKNDVPLTRKNYLEIAYMGDPPPEPLDAELEAEIPEELSRVIDIRTRRPVARG